ncbi:hypothetical protein Plec18170_009551 [Paecilomyces lecythidis]
MGSATRNEIEFDSFFNVIGGKLTTTAVTRSGVNPATELANAPVPVSTKDDVDLAVASAKEAINQWSATPTSQRRDMICAFADAMEANLLSFAKMLTTEQGRPSMVSKDEVRGGVHWLKAIANLELPDELLKDNDSVAVVVRYVPTGVTVGIVPWNFPILLSCAKIAPALITGNTIIIKPSPYTPYCALKIVELAQRFFPPGVIQALSGDDALGPWLTGHPDVSNIHFTGSTVTGKKVMECASKTLKRVTLECGGNDAAIICFILKRLYVHESIYTVFLKELVKATKQLKVGNGTDETTYIGPIQNEMQYEKLRRIIQDIENSGSRFVIGGRPPPSGSGYFINPTIVDCPDDKSRIVVEEQFGPVLPVLKWTTENEVINRANDSIYGLGASVWTADIDTANRMSRQLEAGIVWVNTHFDADPTVSVGGHKQSGIGVEFGVAGLKGFCNSQTIFTRKK